MKGNSVLKYWKQMVKTKSFSCTIDKRYLMKFTMSCIRGKLTLICEVQPVVNKGWRWLQSWEFISSKPSQPTTESSTKFRCTREKKKGNKNMKIKLCISWLVEFTCICESACIDVHKLLNERRLEAASHFAGHNYRPFALKKICFDFVCELWNKRVV